MPQDKSAVSQFLEGENEEQSIFKPEKTIFSEETVTEKSENTEEEVVEKALPFHKDPKVQRYVEKQIAKALEGVSTKSETQKFIQETQPSELMDALTGVIGNDTPEKQRVLKAFEKSLSDIEVKASERALAQFGELAKKEKEQDAAAQRELDDAFEEIEETYNVDLSSNAPSAKKNRSEFIDYVRKIAPKNDDGEVAAFPDLTAAFEEFQEKGKRAAPSNARAKELASRGMTRSSDATQAPATGKSWKEVEKIFNKLS